MREGGQTIVKTMMVSKGITLLSQTATFYEKNQEWIRQNIDLKTWATF